MRLVEFKIGSTTTTHGTLQNDKFIERNWELRYAKFITKVLF